VARLLALVEIDGPHEKALMLSKSPTRQSRITPYVTMCALSVRWGRKDKPSSEYFLVSLAWSSNLGSPAGIGNTIKATITNDAKEHLTIQVSWPAGNGPEEISLHTSAILDEFRPRFAGMCGICAGDPKKVKLGDLVVANKAFKYDSGKMVVGADGQPEHLPDTDTKGPDPSTFNF
jgi:hypothetical protein